MTGSDPFSKPSKSSLWMSADRHPLIAQGLRKQQVLGRAIAKSSSLVRAAGTSQQRLKGKLESSDGFDSSADTSRFDPNARNSYVDSFTLKRLKQGQRVEVTVTSRQFNPVIKLVNDRTRRSVLYGDNIGSTDPKSIFFNTNSRLTFTVQRQAKYSIKVSSLSARESGNYQVKFRFVKAQPTSDFNFFYGSGLTNAAAAVSQAISSRYPQGVAQPVFADVANLGGTSTRLDVVQAPEVWAQGFTGQGVTIAIIDDGVDYSHPALQNNIWNNAREIANNGIDDDRNGFVDDTLGWNFVDNNNDPSDRSLDGHGTHVAGIAAANGDEVKGVAFNAKIMPIKVLDNDGGSDLDIAKGIQYAVNNGAKVINMSLGGEGSSLAPELIEALQLAKRSGVTVMIASGNERQSGGALKPGNPARFAAVQDLGIAVGAVDDRRFLFEDSNPAGEQRLNFLVAPGVSVRSTLPGGEYGFLSGTSMATPHVAGVVALMLSANPSLTVDQIEDILARTARQDVRLTP
ncbi:MAG: S8 family serine peptidase [Timaviella obliquedivisa GSE-PSE-MK23-08B]|nr:S8 family serine peptidase [Timaviella obliquedivisa GSE-PSE-MK23-08B]